MSNSKIVFTTGRDGSIFFINKEGKAIELDDRNKPSLEDSCDLSQLNDKELNFVKLIMQPDIELHNLMQEFNTLGM